MGVSLDGVNPFSMQRSSHSTWPVMVLLYNLPPWLVTKKFFISLSLLISGKQSPTFENIDIYLSPLVEELEELWNRVDVVDTGADKEVERERFKMRGILMWTISDFPAYGLISGLCTKGYLACPVCGANIVSRSVKGPKKYKQAYLGAHRWTRRNHPYRVNLWFNGSKEHRSAPRRQSAVDILQAAKDWEHYLRSSSSTRPGRADGPQDPYRRLGVKIRSALFKLPY